MVEVLVEARVIHGPLSWYCDKMSPGHLPWFPRRAAHANHAPSLGVIRAAGSHRKILSCGCHEYKMLLQNPAGFPWSSLAKATTKVRTSLRPSVQVPFLHGSVETTCSLDMGPNSISTPSRGQWDQKWNFWATCSHPAAFGGTTCERWENLSALRRISQLHLDTALEGKCAELRGFCCCLG